MGLDLMLGKFVKPVDTVAAFFSDAVDAHRLRGIVVQPAGLHQTAVNVKEQDLLKAVAVDLAHGLPEDVPPGLHGKDHSAKPLKKPTFSVVSNRPLVPLS